MEKIRWGVLAPGRIARSFALDLALVPDAELVATGSRSLQRAEAFAAEFGGAAHGSYEELVDDPDVRRRVRRLAAHAPRRADA